MKTEITSSEYWDLPDAIKNSYKRIALVYNGREWVERTYFGSENIEIRVIYKLKSSGNETTFGGMGMGTF